MDKIKESIKEAGGFFDIAGELKKRGLEATTSTEPIPLIRVKQGGRSLVIVNKSNAEAGDNDVIIDNYIVGEL